MGNNIKNILIVDEVGDFGFEVEKGIRDLVEYNKIPVGISATLATDPEAVFSYFEKTTPDVIFVASKVYGSSGKAVVSDIKDSPVGYNVPVVGVSSSPERYSPLVDAHLAGPLTREKLESVVLEYLNK